MKTKLASLVSAVGLSCLLAEGGLASELQIDPWLLSTAHIHNRSIKEDGTGFFVSRVVQGKVRVFLVSNKHVLKVAPTRSRLPQFDVVVNQLENDNLGAMTYIVMATNATGASVVVGHPSASVDVAVVDMTGYLKHAFGVKVFPVPEERFVHRAPIGQHPRVADRAVMFGYPLRLKDRIGIFPLARGGTISTFPTKDFKGQPAFLLDSAVVPGSSGSPVFTESKVPTNFVDPDGKTMVSVEFPLLLGVVSSNLSYPVREASAPGEPSKPSPVLRQDANLGWVFNTAAISQTLDLAAP